MTEPCFADMIQEHLSLKISQNIFGKSGTWKFERFQGLCYKQLWDFGIGKGQQSVAFQE
jgi:hypothetical protein